VLLADINSMLMEDRVDLGREGDSIKVSIQQVVRVNFIKSVFYEEMTHSLILETEEVVNR
jgi:hypothetical protein